MTKQNTKRYENLIIFLFSILPVIDSINGYLTHEGKSSIATFYKLFIILVLFITWLQKGVISRKKITNLISFILLIFISVAFNFIVGINENLRTDCIIKLVFNILTFLLLFENYRCNHIESNALYRIFNYTSVIMICCILIPYLMKMGYSSYEGGLGYKGFYYSLNELNAAQIILFYFCLYKLLYRLTWQSLLQSIGVFLCVLLTSTKSSMIACGLGLLIWLVCYFRKDKSKYKMHKIVGLIVVALILSGFVVDRFAIFMTRQEALYKNYGGSLFATITSGRIFYLGDAWLTLKNSKGYLIQFFIGNGFTTSHLIEMDLFDMFFFLGIAGVGAFITFVVWLLRNCKRNLKNDKTALRKLELYIILAFSFFTGHVVFMATAGCYFALYCCFNLLFNSSDLKKLPVKAKLKSSLIHFNYNLSNKEINTRL